MKSKRLEEFVDSGIGTLFTISLQRKDTLTLGAWKWEQIVAILFLPHGYPLEYDEENLTWTCFINCFGSIYQNE